MSFQIGDTVEAYRIIAIAGHGGMGEVFKVEHTLTRRVEAMKVLLSGRASADEQRQRFLREIQVQASLNHPHIASVHNAFWVEDDLVMVMELVEGDTLQRLLERGPIPLASGIDYIRQALSALSYAHGHGVIHRDITPSNMIVAPEGTVKLTDFGLAKSPTDQSLTDSGALMGSPHYMSPEQIKGTADLDARTDIYSVGAVLYEMVTRRKAFAADSAFSTMRAHVEGAPLPPLEIAPGLPRALNEIILTALQNEPSARFQTADQFREALGRVNLAAPARRRGYHLHFAIGTAAIAVLFTAMLAGIRQQAPPDLPAPPVKVVLPEPPTFALEAPPPRVEEPVAAPQPAVQPRKPASRTPPTIHPEPLPMAAPPPPPTKRAVEPPVVAEIKEEKPTRIAEIAAAPEDPPAAPEEPKKKGNRFRRFFGKVVHSFR